MSQRHSSQIKGDPSDQIWDNLSTKIIKYNTEQQTTEKTGIHKSVPIINKQGRREASACRLVNGEQVLELEKSSKRLLSKNHQ